MITWSRNWCIRRPTISWGRRRRYWTIREVHTRLKWLVQITIQWDAKSEKLRNDDVIWLTCWGTRWAWLTGLNWGLEGGELEELDGIDRVGFGLSICCPWELRNVEFIEISRERPIEPINNVAGFIACLIVLYFWLLLFLVNNYFWVEYSTATFILEGWKSIEFMRHFISQ